MAASPKAVPRADLGEHQEAGQGKPEEAAGNKDGRGEGIALPPFHDPGPAPGRNYTKGQSPPLSASVMTAPASPGA
jgi:hypothetical protein